MIETLAVSSAADVERIENEAKDEAHRMAQAFGCNYRVVYSIDDYSGYTTETVATIVGYPDGRGSTVEWKVPH
jgi:hypothetical protein